MSEKLAMAGQDPGVPDVSVIREVPLRDLWPPLHQEPTANREVGAAPARALTLVAGPDFPRQFAILLAEGLAGARPVRQLTPWLSKRGSAHLQRLLPLFSTGQPVSTASPASTASPVSTGQRLRVLRVLTARPAPGVVEMTMIVVTGHRTRAVAVRLEQGTRPGTGAERWLCTDIETA